MSSQPKRGSITADEFKGIWRASVDPTYAAPMELVGEGNGFEVIGQGCTQYARVSEAIETTMEACFISPWSGQTRESARGARKATVTLTLARTLRIDLPLVFEVGTLVEEMTNDWGEDGSKPVLTGRRYALVERLVFHPGDKGPLNVQAEAERPGWGYNNPRPGTIQRLVQIGAGFYNDRATLQLVGWTPAALDPGSVGAALLLADNRPDVFIPQHVGYLVQFTAGTNLGFVARAVGYLPPDLNASPPNGGRLDLAQDLFFSATTFTGTFALGERVELRNGGTTLGYGEILATRIDGGTTMRVGLRVRNATNLATFNNVVGLTGGGTATMAFLAFVTTLANETLATWRVLDLVEDCGLTITNALAPVGGRLGMLDALGDERKVFRALGESDDDYAARVGEVADVVSPDAIKRALNRATFTWCFREVGSAEYQGFFFDHDAYDYDLVYPAGVPVGTFQLDEPVVQVSLTGSRWEATAAIRYPVVASPPEVPINTPILAAFTRAKGVMAFDGTPIVGLISGATFVPLGASNQLEPSRRNQVWLDYEHFRAWFFVGLPRSSAGDYGFAYDNHPTGAYDAIDPHTNFYDGQPIIAAALRRRVVQALNDVRAGGVGFDLYLETGTCP